ncbi:MAG: seryl-tRNA synthetase [Candidatus Syntrophoarchaeum butanivorans]|uniref:Seryl-tRNA synthetase n=2 Tax=Candidatus Syntropharchaeum butanivorans TaxID=1839936 RepID=A0A1F2P3M0_9EURY|nr:MAG: seryl-tRNA synthetase [Candidatus Syntrophoarchaeum butanivorans]
MEMEFKLKGSFRCSKEVSDLADLIDDLFKRANETILKKGAPTGKGATANLLRVTSDRVEFEVVSGRYVRAHDAVLRLKKMLSSHLGKEYHIGVREIGVDAFVIRLPSEHPPKKMKIPFVKDISYQDGVIILELDLTLKELEDRVPDRIIRLIEEKIEKESFGGKSEHWELLESSEPRPRVFDKDPTEEMVKRRWIVHGAVRGQWIYGTQITRIFRAFERIVIDELLEPLGYREMIFPKVVGWDVWKRSGHLKGIYPEIYYVCPPKSRDPELWDDVINYYRVTQEVPLSMIRERLDDPIGGLCYAQCPPFWPFLQGQTIANESVPVKIFDRSGTSHRYESGGIHGIERVDEFHRIEILWIGTPDQVIKESKLLQERYKRIFDEILDLEWRSAWVTPWFMAQEGMTGLSEEREVGTIDYEAILPYNNTWLEFQNLSVNGDKYPKGFNVKLQSGEILWSGCSGIGLERWAAVFLAQKGFDQENWPSEFRDILGDVEEGAIRLV